MKNTMLIQLTDQRAAKLLRELEELNLIKVLQVNASPDATPLSKKYRGSISAEEGKKLDNHIEQMRSEWSDI
jgi:hypothetical protein